MHIVQAESLAADSAVKMYVIVVVLMLAAGLLAQGVLYGATAIVNAVQQPFLFEGVQCAVERHAVILLAYLLLNRGMCQRMLVFQKKVKNIGAALGFAQAICIQNLMKFVHAQTAKGQLVQ
jgi:hypothetical protein